MTPRQQTLQLRFELLRVRAQIEREELAAAVRDLRSSTRQLRRIGAVAGQVGSAATGRGGGWLGIVAGALLERPWLAGLALTLLRSVRRHPALTFGLALAAVAALRWGRRGSPADNATAAPAPKDSGPSEPQGSDGRPGEAPDAAAVEGAQVAGGIAPHAPDSGAP